MGKVTKVKDDSNEVEVEIARRRECSRCSVHNRDRCQQDRTSQVNATNALIFGRGGHTDASDFRI